MDLKLEVVVIPVPDVDKAKEFYVDTLGFRADAAFFGPDGNEWFLQEVAVRAPGR
ncbi:VOC family protein [Streptomyces sp. NPDC020472]|uniref:VOC family protein n=1 Tax=Streptomyces sp. NPDC020472 TaxID=3365075 RepID=UPI0037A6F3C6